VVLIVKTPSLEMLKSPAAQKQCFLGGGGVATGLNFKKGGAFFCDSTIFIAETAPEIWGALMRDRRIVLARPMVEELQPWLRDPRGSNVEIHPHVNLAVDGKPSEYMRLEKPLTDVVRIAADYYLALLAIRKHSLELAATH
jgi:hypothetical protein